MSIFGSQKTTTTQKIPSWLEAGSQQAVQLGQQIGSQAYTPYTGQRVAGLSQNEQQASELARFGTNEPRSYLERADEAISGVQKLEGADLSGYMNPYLDAVLTPQLREANRAYERERTRLANSKAGAWGGDRSAFAESELERRHAETITDVTGAAHAGAFDRAVQMFASDQDRQMRVADALRAVGGDVSRLNREQVQDLMLTGGVERLLRQADLDFDLQQFQEARDWDIRNLEPLLASLRVPHTSTTEEKASGGGLGQVLGAALTLGSAFFTGGTSLGFSSIGSGAAANSALAAAGFD